MYSESDLQAAVDAKVLTPEAAMALRSHIASARSAPAADEESFRLITGFNDIFVSIAAVILLIAVGWIGASIHTALGGAFVAVSAWFLAEYFTRKRRMALPSIVLVLAFSGGVFATMVGFMVEHGEAIFGRDPGETVGAIIVGAMALITAGGDLGCTGAASWCRSPSLPEPPRSSQPRWRWSVDHRHARTPRRAGDVAGADRRYRRVRARDVVGPQRPGAPDAAQRRRLLAPPARRADDRPSVCSACSA